jgi:hypothetical protein
MTVSDVLLALFGVVMTMIGWWVRVMWEAQNKLRDDLSEIERQLPETYVRRDDFRDLVSGIHATLVRIEAKLDGKADKP